MDEEKNRRDAPGTAETSQDAAERGLPKAGAGDAPQGETGMDSKTRRTWVAAIVIVALVIAGNVALWMGTNNRATLPGIAPETPPSGSGETSTTEDGEPTESSRPDMLEGELASVGMRYARSSDHNHQEQWLVVDGEAQQDDPGADWRFAASVIEAAQSVADIDTKGTSSVDKAISMAKDAAGDDESRKEFVELLEELKENGERPVSREEETAGYSTDSSAPGYDRFTPESILEAAGEKGDAEFSEAPSSDPIGDFVGSLLGGSPDSTSSDAATQSVSPDASASMPADASRREPAPLDGETYADNTEPGFLATEEHPVSTVAADVDTASYTNFRRMVRDGNGPDDIPADSVRVEEWLNYFDYGYATPDEGEAFGATSHLGECPWAEGHKLLTLGFATDPEVAKPEGGRNVVLLVDVSGSMSSSDKLPFLKQAAEGFVAQLGEGDTVSLVTYANEGKVVLDGVSGSDHTRIMAAVRGLHADGATNGGAGLKDAYAVAHQHFAENGSNRIFLCSDGDMNLGMSSTEELTDYVDQRRSEGIYLSVLGFGTGNYHDQNMESIADHGNGSYYYIDCAEEAERVLARGVAATMTPVADDAKIQVEFNPASVKSYRLVGYVDRTLAAGDFKNDDKDGGEVCAGDRFTVAYEIVPATKAEEVPEVELRYGNGEGATDEGVEFKGQEDVPEGLRNLACRIGGKEYEEFDPAVMSYDVEFAEDEELPSMPELRGLGEGWEVESSKSAQSPSGDFVSNNIVVTNGESTRQYVFRYVRK